MSIYWYHSDSLSLLISVCLCHSVDVTLLMSLYISHSVDEKICGWEAVPLRWLIRLKIWQKITQPFLLEESTWSLKTCHITTDLVPTTALQGSMAPTNSLQYHQYRQLCDQVEMWLWWWSLFLGLSPEPFLFPCMLYWEKEQENKMHWDTQPSKKWMDMQKRIVG